MVQVRFSLDEAIKQVLHSPSDRFTDLAELAGLNPSSDFRFSDLRNCDFRHCDLTGFNFIGARLEGGDFAGALVAGALFDKRTIESGILATALDFHELLTGEKFTQDDTFIDLLQDLPKPFFWQEQLWKIIGCLRAGKSVNVWGSRGAGKTLLLNAAEKYLERRFGHRVAFIEVGSRNLGESLLRGFEKCRRRWDGMTAIILDDFEPKTVSDAVLRINEGEAPIFLIDDAHEYEPTDVLELITICETNGRSLVLTSTLPISETVPATSRFFNWIVPAAMPRLDYASVATTIKMHFAGGAPQDLDNLFREAAGLNIGQIERLVDSFRTRGSSRDLLLHSFLEELLQCVPFDERPAEEVREEASRILNLLYRAKTSGVTLKQLAARAKLPLEVCERVVRYLRASGFVVRKNRRAFVVASPGMGILIASAAHSLAPRTTPTTSFADEPVAYGRAAISL